MKACIGSIVALGAFLALAGCAGQDPTLRQHPDYSIGYSDGCTSGNSRVTGFKNTIKRDKSLWDSSEPYRAGWKDGFGACGGNENRDPNVFDGEDRWYQQGPVGQ
jgi:hypothetical protein